MASGGSAPRGQFLDVRLELKGDAQVVARKKRSGWNQGDLSRPCRADAVAAPQRLQQGVRDRLCAAPRTPWRRQQGVPCHSALGGTQQAFHLGV